MVLVRVDEQPRIKCRVALPHAKTLGRAMRSLPTRCKEVVREKYTEWQAQTGSLGCGKISVFWTIPCDATRKRFGFSKNNDT